MPDRGDLTLLELVIRIDRRRSVALVMALNIMLQHRLLAERVGK